MTETYEQKVEKVARAIQDAHAPGHPLNHVALYQARAALAALGITDTAPAPAISGGELDWQCPSCVYNCDVCCYLAAADRSGAR